MANFGGKPENWEELWDTFESAIHKNYVVADIYKFAYLQCHVTESAKASIAGFCRTAAYCHLAVEVLLFEKIWEDICNTTSCMEKIAWCS